MSAGTRPAAVLLLTALAAAPVSAAEPPLPEAVPCLPCHGRENLANKPEVPSILGQDAKYLIHQIIAFQRDLCPTCQGFTRLDRRHPVMSERSHKVDKKDAETVAAYFRSQACVNAWELDGGATEPLAKPQIANTCFLCHGEAGRSRHAFIPTLAGQRRNYLRVQLRAFRDTKWSDRTRPVERYRVHNMMTRQGQRLNDAEIDGLAAYFSSQPCR